MKIYGKKAALMCSLFLLLSLSACASLGSSGATLYASDQWFLLPVANNSSTASASAITESMLESNLRVRGVQTLRSTSDSTKLGVSSTQSAIDGQLKLAKSTGARYAVKATVEQWGRMQRNGRDSRVELSLGVYDLSNGRSVWHSDQTEFSRLSGSFSKVANTAIAKLVNRLNIVTGFHPDTEQTQHQLAVSTTSDVISDSRAIDVGGSTLGFRKVALDDNGFSKEIKRDLSGKSLAIFYGANPPVDELSQFDRLVLEPDNVSFQQLQQLTEDGAQAYAYLSVGEVGPTRSYAQSIKQEWVLGKNDTWNSTVLDMQSAGWTDFLMRRIDSLLKAGYTGLFLDTMDSYQLYAKSAEQRLRQENAIGAFIQRISVQYPGIKLISNRGFEVLDRTGQYLEAVAAESLFASWDNAAQQYVDVSESDRQWLLGKLNTAKSQHGVDIIAIEYMPPERRAEARQVATQVANLGFTPWVSTPALDYIGVGTLEVMPRKVMLLFDSRIHGNQASTEVHELVAPIIEYYGYVPKYLDVATEPLPSGELVGQYAGMVTWSSGVYAVSELAEWFERQIDRGLPVAMFGSPIVPLNNVLAMKLGIKQNRALHTDSLKSVYKSELMDFEKSIPVRVESIGMNVRNQSEQNEVHLTLSDKNGTHADLVVLGQWGGFASHPAASNADMDDTYYWVTDPFAFLQRSLKLKSLPMPDVTSENGNRLWAAHIDGDALPSWAEMPGQMLGAEYIEEKILKRYNMPHSISIVEAEMTSVAAYADRRQRMFEVAKRIFAMPSVELATHTFSHPYKWEAVGKHPGSGKYNLDVGDYQYSATREIAGSAQFINEKLAPPNKKTELMLWSGNALPEESAMAAAYDAGLTNLNGGFTTISKAAPSVSRISPMARTVGRYVQAYAPIMNENVYTNDWRGPFDGFRRVIETFEMTDKPRRFKPLSIYYHFYAGTKMASLRSLIEIYDWSTQQDILPVYASTYAKKVPDFRKAGVARYLDGTWKVSSLGSIKSLRILDKDQWPSLQNSQGLVGSRQLHDGMYLHTDGSDQVIFKTGNQAANQIHLVSANGHVENWQRTRNGIDLRIAGQVPVKLELSRAASACVIHSNGQSIRAKKTSRNTAMFSFTNRDTGNVTLNCQA